MASKKKIKVDISKLEIIEIVPKTQVIKNLPEFNKSESVKIKYGVQLNPLYSLSADLVKIDLTITMSFEKDDDNEEVSNVGEFSYDFVYRYENLSELTDSEGDISPEIFLTCSNISYSTLRGIIYAKSANTCIADALIPIVTGSELMDGLL
jgi:hypothetical protein